jgi:SAM-dependent methyltransferase
MDVDAYYDDVAAFYDGYYDEQGDERFYRRLASEADGPVLEVGCGTGRIHLDLLRNDVDAYGIDVSTESLAVLREKARADGLDPSVRRADVREFEPRREYALVIVPFRAFLHLLEVDDQLSALERIHDALAPGGRLVLTAFVPNFDVICDRYGQWDEREIEVDGVTYTLRTVSRLDDVVEQRTRIRTEIVDADGETVRESETSISLVSKREFELLFRLSPFTDWTVHGGFDREPLESADQEQVWIADR